ncbi:MAG TPA: alpha/beta hydrolase domain-containing protein [Longimicrobiales bacterium]|nr:alpha/beta hydrolase domain-containing protein [Longimicrobiales bacterium]
MAALACIVVALASPSEAQAQQPGRATLAGPLTGGERGQPFGGLGAGLPAGWVEEEWLLSGEAASYHRSGAWGPDGRWDVTPDETEPFTVRLLVRRPSEASRFNGVVVVEWLNVTARAEGAADYMQMAEELVRGGYAWVGVGAQAIGIHAPGTGLKAWDPVRYRQLEHPGDRFSYDVFSHAARLLRAAEPGGPLGDLAPEHLIAAGRSQSAFRLVTYLNAFHPRTPLFDGYFVHSRGATAAGLRAEALAADEPDPIPDGARIRTDLDVPILDVQTEGDMVTLGAHHTRQPASDTYRRWEIAGAAHTEIPMWVPEVPPELPRGPGCADPVNTAPHHAFVKAGLRALAEWVRSGRVPPQSPELQLRDPSATDPVQRDARGNALGGIRIPELAAPTATLDGRQNSVVAGAPGGQNFCFLYGNTRPFDDATLGELYPTHRAFVERFVQAVDALERDGYLLAPEAEEARRAAEASGIGR